LQDTRGRGKESPRVSWQVSFAGTPARHQERAGAMLSELLQKANLFHLLFQLDLDLASKCRLSDCPFCGGKLHQSNYVRKPRGGPPLVAEQYLLRHSFCCAAPGCRRRVLPGSCRFWGRRVYWAAVILVVTALGQGRTSGFSANKLSRLFGIDRKTICRWKVYYREHFPQTPLWRKLRGKVGADIKDSEVCAGLVGCFINQFGSQELAIAQCLQILASGT
jgi:hypothetical protein